MDVCLSPLQNFPGASRPRNLRGDVAAATACLRGINWRSSLSFGIAVQFGKKTRAKSVTDRGGRGVLHTAETGPVRRRIAAPSTTVPRLLLRQAGTPDGTAVGSNDGAWF